MSMEKMPDGMICHLEIHAPDLEKSAKFYTEIFNWKVDVGVMPDYALWQDTHGGAGGFSTAGEPNTTQNYFYLKVEDMEAMLAKLRDAGTEILSDKTQISPEHGYIALFKDPGGNIIGLWSQN
ncbi:MAG: VOC family protein [candidate division Zixibacteria bacterium]|nr:VOC family protein [candidate division Zixibacteria bacterium]